MSARGGAARRSRNVPTSNRDYGHGAAQVSCASVCRDLACRGSQRAWARSSSWVERGNGGTGERLRLVRTATCCRRRCGTQSSGATPHGGGSVLAPLLQVKPSVSPHTRTCRRSMLEAGSVGLLPHNFERAPGRPAPSRRPWRRGLLFLVGVASGRAGLDALSK